MSRKEYNIEIINMLLDIIKENPDFRFGQILFNNVLKYAEGDTQIFIEDPFYEESEITYNRLKNNYDHRRSAKFCRPVD